MLRGLSVGVDAHSRCAWFAARCLRDLGATVVALTDPGHDETDRLWLGAVDRVTSEAATDLVICDRARVRRERDAPATVIYTPTSSRSAAGACDLDERELAAVGGMAVAIGDPDGGALHLPSGCVDALVGAHLAGAGLAALIEGTRHTEIAGADVIAWVVATNMQLYLPYELPWFRSGRRASGSGSCYPWSLFDAKDGLFCMIGRTDRDWLGLKAAMGNPSWGEDPRFADPRTVGRRYPEAADAYVAPWVARHTRAELIERLGEYAVACAPALRPEEVVSLPELDGRWRTAHNGAGLRIPGPVQEVTLSRGAAGKALDQLFVLDLAWVWSGPAVSVGLADLGANVVKVESSLRPDNTRQRGRPQDGSVSEDGPALEMAPYFHALNRGKRSISLNLKTEEGLVALRALAARADVIVENLSAGVMERWGISPAQVHAENPGCVFVRMRGYRDHQATRGLRAYAPTLSSRAGMESLVGYPDASPLGAMNIAFSDAFAASYGVLLALAGAHSRARHGRGAAIELSQFEAAVLANGRNVIAAQLGSVAPLRSFASGEPMVVSAEDLPASDWISPDLFGSVSTPWLERVSVAPLPWRRDQALPGVGEAAPVLGADTEEVLGEELGIGHAAVAALTDAGALV
jgi:crotonobetainyl-CoA:carnitine CoA-transferase CaiB-like acyl-CoA transferase